MNPTEEQIQRELEALAQMPDEEIDFSDIPEVTDWSGAIRGMFYHMNNRTKPNATRESLLNDLRNDYANQPQEGGFDHRSEDTLRQALTTYNQAEVLDWLSQICNNRHKPTLAASAIRSLSNLEKPGNPRWRLRLIKHTLKSSSTDVRDAAIQAVEKWQEHRLVGLLQRHEDPIDWLHQYAQGVIQDLTTDAHQP